MRIDKVSVAPSPNPGWFRIHAPIQLRHTTSQYPDTLWYEFPEAYQDWLYMGIETFVLSLHQFAMALGEDIEVDGPFSQRLEYNLREYQRVYHQWYPHYFKRIHLHHAGYDAPPSTGSKAAALFSGGVDSFYTLFSQLPDREPAPDYQVSVAFKIFFDMPRYDRRAFNERIDGLTPALADRGVTLIPVHTNMRRFLVGQSVPERHWFLGKAFVGGLTSVGMLLSGQIARLFLASGWKFEHFHPSGTSWLTDSLLVSEWYETIHHGANQTRAEKIRAIADQPEAQQFLSVCLNQPDRNTSCGACSRCLRTMTTLELLGKRKAFRVFETPSRSRQIWEMSRLIETYYIQENLALAHRQNNSRYVWLLRLTWFVYRLRQVRRALRLS